MSPTPYVLIADDQKEMRDLLRFALVSNGHEVLIASDGLEALEVIRQHQPIAILLDLMMPRMDGYEVFCTLQAKGLLVDIPVIILTGRHLEDRDRQRLKGASAVYYKGQFEVPDLLAMLNAALNPLLSR